MSVVSDAADELAAVLRAALPDVRVYTDPAATVDPPGLVIVPPTLTWSAYRADPTDAAFVVALVVRNDERAAERLWDLVPQVAAAVDEGLGVAVRRAEPGTWTSSNLPAYLIEIEVALS